MCSATENRGDVSLGYAEKLGDLDLRHLVSQLSDFGHFICAQEFLEQRNTANVDSVLPITLIGCPFQIDGYAVSFVAIDVVDDRKVKWIGDERQCHESMDVDRLAPSISKEIDVGISKFIRGGADNLAVYSSGLKSVADAIETSDAAEIAHLVEIPEVRDRDRSPFFNLHDIHVAGGPSGLIGSTIKNPPHATNVGGFGHYGSAFQYLQ
jgi:hypothetical protein